MIFFWPKVYGPLGKTPYIYPRYQVWGVTDLNFDLAYYHPPLLNGTVVYKMVEKGGRVPPAACLVLPCLALFVASSCC